MSSLCGNSRKIRAFLWMALSIMVCAALLTKVGTPEAVITQAMWIIGFGGLFTIGGQSLIDTVSKWAETKK